MKKNIEPTHIIARYRIEYESEHMTQEKNLIKHRDYEDTVKPMENEIYSLERKMYNADEEKKRGYRAKVKNIKSQMMDMFGDSWFTNKSPIFKAIIVGEIRLLENQGGPFKCKLTKI